MDGGEPVAVARYQSYLESVEDRLRARGYQRRHDGPREYETTAYHRRKLSLTRLVYVDYFVVAGRFESLTAEGVRAYGEACLEYGLDNQSAFPRWLGSPVAVFPVIVAEAVPESVRQWVREYDREHWGAFELPVIVDLASAEAT